MILAIGKSTNLIARDSNIIVIRGGNGKGLSVNEQMRLAVTKFFPESGIVKDDLRRSSTSSRDEERNNIPLHRINSGVSSIVGKGNGERDGGFVLVVDGAALLSVRPTNLLTFVHDVDDECTTGV